MPSNRHHPAPVRDELPDTTVVSIDSETDLETLHVPGQGPALVFVHGGLGSLWNHYLQFEYFRGEREIVAYSLAGYGGSSAPPVGSMFEHAKQLRKLLDELGVADVVICGWSYGAAIALEYANEWSVSGLVLGNGADNSLTPWWEPPLVNGVLASGLYRLFRGETVPKSFLRSRIFHSSMPESALDKFIETQSLPLPKSSWEVLRSFWGYDRSDGTHDIEAPTAVVHGPADGLVPAAAARQTAGRIPGAVYCTFERSGHAVMFERPQRYNALVELVVDSARTGDELAPLVRERFG
ncbi:alpha/beta hydrolase [Haloarcula sp. S1CR25-12]|uniref:Alpha/beta hydrolase n=1 Tax=Haloarcula saliterrae TaxID=2950534 RepID=A0ABU2FG59_9EURY|nr:alpha/beta hydrolase [Haloarcula sp. S1CR25-12]MDS0261253.1 alpha/beta hydrolase [Haloarcula sp. S1CR25-12]